MYLPDAIPSALDVQDDVVQLKTAQILTVFLASETTPIAPNRIQPFLNTLSSFLVPSFPHKRDLAVQCLEALLPRREVRKAVWGIPQIIQGYGGKIHSYPNLLPSQLGRCHQTQTGSPNVLPDRVLFLVVDF